MTNQHQHQHQRPVTAGHILAVALTFAAMTVSVVFFRAPSLACAASFLDAMLGGNGVEWSTPGMHAGRWALLALALAVAWIMPNTQQILRRQRPGLGGVGPHEEPALLRRLEWRPSLPWAIALSLSTVLCLLQLSSSTPFIYYQF